MTIPATFLALHPVQFVATLITGYVLADMRAWGWPRLKQRYDAWRTRRVAQLELRLGIPRQTWFGRQWRRKMQRDHVRDRGRGVVAAGATRLPRRERREAERLLVQSYRRAAKQQQEQRATE